MPQDAEWKILAEEVAQEQNPVKLLEIVLALTAPIDEAQSNKAQHFQKQTQTPITPPAA